MSISLGGTTTCVNNYGLFQVPVTNANGIASHAGDSGLFKIFAISQISSCEAQNLGLKLLITSFCSHLGVCLARGLLIEDEGVCSKTSFPLLLLLGVVFIGEGSPSICLVSVDPVACTLVSWEGDWEYLTICPSLDTSSVTLFSNCFS